MPNQVMSSFLIPSRELHSNLLLVISDSVACGLYCYSLDSVTEYTVHSVTDDSDIGEIIGHLIQ